MASKEAYVTGVGQSEIGVRLERHPLLLTVDAIREAMDEAGLTTAQIDGVFTYPGKMDIPPGFSPVSAYDVMEALGIEAKWHLGGSELPAQLSAVADAALAVKAGLCRHAVVFRTVYEAAGASRPDEYPRPANSESEGVYQWMAPFWSMSTACWLAMDASRHMHRYGMTREHLAAIAINDSRNAMLNPRARAITKQELTLDAYMAARTITTPFCLYDCDRYSDGSTAIIVSAGDALDEVKCTPLRIAAMSGAVKRYSWDQSEWPASYEAGNALWAQTDYRPNDVDIAQFYDGFSFLPITWLEGLGFCEIGEGPAFLEGGKRIARDGALPMNTGGGQLGAGRMHGFGFLHEAAVQLRGNGGERQVAGEPKLAIATSGGGPMAAALLIAKD